MSEATPAMADEIYAPNQQLVRPDGSGPAEQGDGGSAHDDPLVPEDKDAVDLDAMTKDGLLAYAEQLGVEVDATMTKAQIKEAIAASG